MKRIVTLSLVVCFVAVAAMADIDGSWTASYEEKRPDRIYINMSQSRNHNMGTTMRLSDLPSLTRDQIGATTMTPVQFRLQREAGTATFEGTFRNGKGAGQFSFAGNRAYIAAIEALGVKFDLDRPHPQKDEEQLFALAVNDVSTSFIKSMQAEGFKVSLEKYLQMRIFDITPEYIREMRSLGFSDIDDDELVASKIHKVTPDYIRKMRAAGWNLSLEELQSSRIHQATPEFAAEMRKLGYGDLAFDDLVSFRIHRVTPEFIEEMRKLGYDELSADDLLSMRIHKVTAEFVGDLRQLGYDNVAADDLVAMRIHRVTPEFIREIQQAGYKNVPVDKLVSMRIHGIDAKYLKKMSGS
jgi:hypothetical protein